MLLIFNKVLDKFPLYEIIYTWTYGSMLFKTVVVHCTPGKNLLVKD